MIGRRLGHYTLVSRLGAGGMGEVFAAEDANLRRRVALKLLPPSFVSDRDRIERFKREARLLAALAHPHIVSVFSVEEAEDLHFLTMELIEGRNLGEVIASGRLSLARLFRIAVPLADALAAAHDKGIVHRDLKPSNIMIGPQDSPKILDFGLAKFTPEVGGADSNVSTDLLSAEGAVVGTLPYMSPEQAEGKPVDSRSDIFSLGVVLYEAATGERPFKGDSAAALLSAILKDTPPTISEIRSDLPQHLARIVGLCLEKDVDRRFQSARDVRNELASFRREVETKDASGTLAARRPRSWKAGLVAGAVALVGLIALLTFFMRKPADWPVATGTVDRLAVLPLANLTGSPENDYLCQGISAGLTQRLSELRGIRLVTSSETGTRRDATPASRMAARLGVDLLVEGDVQPAALGFRVNVALISGDDGVVLWSRGFSADAEDVIDLQREVASQLTTVLALSLSGEERQRLRRDPTDSYEAYDAYLRGHELLEGTNDPTALRLAADFFREAIELDEEFALAHVALSEALWQVFNRGLDSDALTEAESQAELALEIDPDLPDAQVALARVYRSTGRYESAIAAAEGVLARHPRPAEALRSLGMSHEQVGDLEEAESSYSAATTLGPEDWLNWNALGALLTRKGEYKRAREVFVEAGGRAPARVTEPKENLAGLSILEGDFEGALAVYESLPQPIRDGSVASNMGTAYYFSSRPNRLEKAEESYRLAVQLDPTVVESHGNLADVLLESGDREGALESYAAAIAVIDRKLGTNPQPAAGAFTQWRPLYLQRAIYQAKAEQCQTAVGAAYELREAIPDTARDLHDLAYVFALCREDEAAIEALTRSVRKGFSTELIAIEAEFAHLHGRADFESLMAAEP